MSTSKFENMNLKALEIIPSPKTISRLKEIFRRWYGSLSIREIVSNRKLIAEIESFERLLTGKEPLSC
jgi:hypothetical protein